LQAEFSASVASWSRREVGISLLKVASCLLFLWNIKELISGCFQISFSCLEKSIKDFWKMLFRSFEKLC
jgi:hypothetical protein